LKTSDYSGHVPPARASALASTPFATPAPPGARVFLCGEAATQPSLSFFLSWWRIPNFITGLNADGAHPINHGARGKQRGFSPGASHAPQESDQNSERFFGLFFTFLAVVELFLGFFDI